jgi:hypothetical protein
VSWGARFDDPIALANGRKLLTLQDAATHITNLPKRNLICRNGRPRSRRTCSSPIARTHHVRSDRRDEGSKPTRRARVRSVTEGSSLAKAKAEGRPITHCYPPLCSGLATAPPCVPSTVRSADCIGQCPLSGQPGRHLLSMSSSQFAPSRKSGIRKKFHFRGPRRLSGVEFRRIDAAPHTGRHGLSSPL